MKRKLRVCLNGTTTNPFHKWGLSQNPFPQTGRYQEDRFSLVLQKLGGDPIPNTAYIREVLQGFSDEFVDLCCARFVPGKYVEFDLSWEE